MVHELVETLLSKMDAGNNSQNASAQTQSLPFGAGRRPLTEEEKNKDI